MTTGIRRLEATSSRPPFSCGKADLDDYFHTDSIEGAKELISVTYAWHDGNELVAFFSLSNDSLCRENIPRSAYKRLVSPLSERKRYSSMPAVKIGRLGVCSDKQGNGYGQKILDYLKAWFKHGNKTGCRFILVDAYNDPKTTNFYKKNGFVFLTGEDEKEKTRIMYFDLITFKL